VFENHTVFHNLELALSGNKTVRSSLFSTLCGEEKDLLENVLERIGLRDKRYVLAGSLSHGQKQWLEIGMLLMQRPRLLLVDEPVAGMTHQEMDQTGELLLDLKGEHSIMVVEHDMEFIRSIADKVTVLHQGSVLAEGPMAKIQTDPKVIEVYLGESTC
jgi:urea transport system ATP-binding protein